MNSELDSPPFDPTPAEVAEVPPEFRYTIVSRGSVVNTVVGIQIPDKTLDESAWSPNTDGCQSEGGFWRKLLGPSKVELQAKINQLQQDLDYAETMRKTHLAEAIDARGEIRDLYKKNEVLKKQVAIWEQTYQTASELAEQRIQDIAMLRHNLNTANEEIERLCMAPQLIAKSKAPRPKKGKQ